jgi:Tol biopolymer transport system component
MKKQTFLSFLFVLSILLIPFFAKSQNRIAINKIEQIKEIQTGYNVFFSPTGDNLFFTSLENDGLSVYKLKNKKVLTLNSDLGAGFEPSISKDGKTIFYKTYTIDPFGKRYSSIIAQNIETLEKDEVIENQRNLSSVYVSENDVLFADGEQIKKFFSSQKQIKACNETAVFTNSNLDLIVFNNQEIKILNPIGKQNYIWVSLSPDKRKILFNAAGKASYVCNLEGKMVAELGRINAPKWSKTGEYIIGMNDKDNGEEYTSSEIVLFSTKNFQKQVLELKDYPIALFPSFSPNDSKIVFNNPKGEVFLISLK